MTRRLAIGFVAAFLSAGGILLPGMLRASAAPKIPPVCVEHQVGPAHIEVGYCPNG